MKNKNYFKKALLVFLVCSAQFITAQLPSYVPTNGLVGYYTFSGNANDESGNGNNGVGTNVSYSQDRFIVDNKSLQVTGNGYISVLNSSNLKSLNNVMTVSGWFKPTTFYNNQWYPLICKSNSYSPQQFSIQAGPDAINLLNNGVCYQYLTTIKLNTWYFFAIVQNQNTVKFYLNDLNYTTSTPNGYTYTYSTNNNIEIGRDIYGATEYSNGKIDDIGIWNRALTADEITNLYNANLCYQSSFIINTGVLSYNPPTYNNTITIYPNPANDHITIDCGTIANVVGYHIEIANSLGQVMFNKPMNTQQYTVALNTWSGQGIYFVKVYDASNTLLTTRKLILQ